jgi:hypothetical protein
VSATALTQIWNLTGPQTMSRATTWNRLVDTGQTPPSGDGDEGGNYHGWFEVTRAQ